MNKSPVRSLQEGHWFKLICGASFQDLPTIRTLALVYSLAGADCLDLAADEAVITAAQEGIIGAQRLRDEITPPWLMVSINDAEDPHFRKATFDPQFCPPDCPRPCEAICPAAAIAGEVLEARCYGCGRCLPVCPSQLITTRSRLVNPAEAMALVQKRQIPSLEIHTQVGHQEDFLKLKEAIAPYWGSLKLLAISCQDHPDLLDYLYYLYETLSPLPCPLVWQTDGRPMSGDLGKGTTHSTIRMAQKVLESSLPGYVQLAGGTNDHTGAKLKSLGLGRAISGIAYGSFARTQLQPVLDSLEHRTGLLEDHPDLLAEALEQATNLVRTLKPEKFFSKKDH